MKIFLLGLPGSGKTTLGQQLAIHEKLNFVDLDDEIEKQEGHSITEIFEGRGESHFRKIENAVLSSFAKSDQSFVMATGGGTPCFNNNIERMNESGTAVFLDVSPEICAKRIIKSEISDRPMFKNLDEDQIPDQVKNLRMKRLGYYQKANKIVRGDTIKLNDVLKAISS